MGTLRLDNIKELQAGETETVYLRREKEVKRFLLKLINSRLPFAGCRTIKKTYFGQTGWSQDTNRWRKLAGGTTNITK